MAGCGSSESTSTAATAPSRAGAPAATATLRPLAHGHATGTAAYTSESGRQTLKVELRGLTPTRGEGQYYLWQIETPEDRVSLDSADNMVNLASYRVGRSGNLTVELEPTAKAFVTLENGDLTHFLVTKVGSPSQLESSILRFDHTGRPPNLGLPVAEGVFSGSLVGAAARR
jgi:hypothetical protein